MEIWVPCLEQFFNVIDQSIWLICESRSRLIWVKCLRGAHTLRVLKIFILQIIGPVIRLTLLEFCWITLIDHIFKTVCIVSLRSHLYIWYRIYFLIVHRYIGLFIVIKFRVSCFTIVIFAYWLPCSHLHGNTRRFIIIPLPKERGELFLRIR